MEPNNNASSAATAAALYCEPDLQMAYFGRQRDDTGCGCGGGATAHWRQISRTRRPRSQPSVIYSRQPYSAGSTGTLSWRAEAAQGEVNKKARTLKTRRLSAAWTRFLAVGRAYTGIIGECACGPLTQFCLFCILKRLCGPRFVFRCRIFVRAVILMRDVIGEVVLIMLGEKKNTRKTSEALKGPLLSM